MSFSFPSQAGQLSPELSALVPMVVEQTSRVNVLMTSTHVFLKNVLFF